MTLPAVEYAPYMELGGMTQLGDLPHILIGDILVCKQTRKRCRTLLERYILLPFSCKEMQLSGHVCPSATTAVRKTFVQLF